MSYYEKEKARLEKFMEEILSDVDSDDSVRDKDYEISSEDENSSSSSGQNVSLKKKPKLMDDKNIPTTSKAEEKSSTINDTIERIVTQYQLSPSSSDDDDVLVSENKDLSWGDVNGQSRKHLVFCTQNSGFKDHFFEMFDKEPVDLFKLFVNDDILDLIVTETNRYAHQQLDKGGHRPKSRIHKWVDTNKEEIKVFFCIIIWMGLKKLPKLCSYWSKNVLYENKMAMIMSRNRFELLLANLHFSDNETSNTNTRLYKLAPLLDKLIPNFKNVVVPSEELCIDETLVPFRGRLSFRQYIKNKRHRFGVKVYKLCLDAGFTYDLKIYCGADKSENTSVPDSVVFYLANDLLDVGRTIYTDNFYTSVTLAHSLLERNTHLVGTLRQNRKLNPKEITTAKLRKGEIVGRESNTGVIVSKWKDKRDVLMLSTKHTLEMVDVHQKGGVVQKPASIIAYNKSKGFIDISDQIKSYSTPLRKSVKWYRKIAIELLFGSAMVNAYVMFKRITNRKISITSFKEEVVSQLINLSNLTNIQSTPSRAQGHYLEEVQSLARRRCNSCYARLSSEHGRKFAQNKTPFSRYKCIQCDKFYCIECFCNVHVCNLKV